MHAPFYITNLQENKICKKDTCPIWGTQEEMEQNFINFIEEVKPSEKG